MSVLVFSARRSPEEAKERIRLNDEFDPEWRDKLYDNGAPLYDSDGTILDHDGSRSIFDDVDE